MMMNNIEKNRKAIEAGITALGIELGSTRIKAVLIDDENQPIALGAHDWTNQLIDGIWTYDLDNVWAGIQDAYAKMAADVKDKYDIELEKIGAIGFSGMMHGYVATDKEDRLLVPFRTWRNNLQSQASEALQSLFDYPVPQRFSIAHLYQAILNGESHVKEIAYVSTIAGYVHWQLTGEKVMGIGEASGMFPMDIETGTYNSRMIDQFNELIADKGYGWKLEEIFPKVLTAGQGAGVLTRKGASLLDPTGKLKAGVPLCPPEGDAGTGMVATDTVSVRTGNVSAGTSVFAMIVLEKELSKVYSEIDLVTTPHGKLVAMAHSNNCTSDLDSWISLFEESYEAMGMQVDKNKIYETLYTKALEADPNCGGLLAYGYLSGEHVTHFEEGRPMFVRSSENQFNLANFMRVHLYTALGAMKIGLDILLKEEGVKVDKILGHGGLFKTKDVGQRCMAAASGTPVEVMETAGEGGAWGIAILASYLINAKEGESLDDFLKQKVFTGQGGYVVDPLPEEVEGYEVFHQRYKEGLSIEREAVTIHR